MIIHTTLPHSSSIRTYKKQTVLLTSVVILKEHSTKHQLATECLSRKTSLHWRAFGLHISFYNCTEEKKLGLECVELEVNIHPTALYLYLVYTKPVDSVDGAR